MKYSFDDYRDIILRAFEYMYCEVNTYSDHEVHTNKMDELAIKNFVADFQLKGIDPDNIDYILNFIESSFNYFVRLNEDNPNRFKHGLRSLHVSWIIGKSAIARHEYFQSKFGSMTRFLRFVRTKVKADLYSKFDEHVTYNDEGFDIQKYIELSSVEEKFKNLYYNQELSLEHCFTGTYLYNHKSSLCVFCIHNKKCKELLRKEYPNLFVKRGYE